MRCPNGHEVGDNVKYCPTCGAEIVRGNKYCTKCGYERIGDEDVCPRCGTAFDSQETYDFDIDDRVQSNKSLLIILSIVAVAFIGIGCWLYLSRGDSKNTVPVANNETDSIQDVDSIESIVFDEDTVEYVDTIAERSEFCYSESSSSDYESSSSNSDYHDTSPSRTFTNEQIVIGYLANQSFRANDGLTMRVDGDGRLYVDGDYAGVLSVLRYNDTAALLRYGGGQYGEGKLSVQIIGDKFQLTDPTDGTVYYQR